MRIALSVLGVVLLFFGGVWFLQGVNVLPGSFMSGQMRWAVRGVLATGCAILRAVAAASLTAKMGGGFVWFSIEQTAARPKTARPLQRQHPQCVMVL